MSKIIKSSNHEIKKKSRYPDSLMLAILSKLPVEIVSKYPHKSLYRCFSTYLRKNPSIILGLQESKYIYHKWRTDEAQKRKTLRYQKNFYFNLNKEFKHYDNKDNYNKYQINNSNESLLNLNEKIDEEINEKIDEKIDEEIIEKIDEKIDEEIIEQIIEEIDDDIDEENFKKKIIEQIEEIDILYDIDNEYKIDNFVYDYIPL